MIVKPYHMHEYKIFATSLKKAELSQA